MPWEGDEETAIPEDIKDGTRPGDDGAWRSELRPEYVSFIEACWIGDGKAEDWEQRPPFKDIVDMLDRFVEQFGSEQGAGTFRHSNVPRIPFLFSPSFLLSLRPCFRVVRVM